MKVYNLNGFVGIDITPQSVSEILKDANGEDIQINMGSIGGYVYDGFQIHNQIRDYKGKKSLYIEGMAASMAAYIATAFDHVKVRDNSTFMIHNVQGGVVGDYRAMEKEAMELKRLNVVEGQAFSERSRTPLSSIIAMMDEETWFYGQEIIDAGFADEIITTSSSLDKTASLRLAQEKVAAFRPPVRQDDVKRAASLFPPESVAGDKIIRSSVSKARGLINNGDYDNTSSWSWSASDGNKLLGPDGDDWANFKAWHMVENTNAEEKTKARYKYPYGKNGKVYRSALRAIASRAAQSGLQELSNIASGLIDLIDEKESSVAGEDNFRGEDFSMPDQKTEIFNKLKAMKANAEITLPELAEALGLKHLVVTDAHTAALQVTNDLKKLLGTEDVVKTVSAMKTELDSGRETVRNAKLDSLFGKQTDDEKNDLRQYMGQQTIGLYGDKLEEKINSIKETDSIAKRFMAERADNTSDENTIGSVEHRDASGAGDSQTAEDGKRRHVAM